MRRKATCLMLWLLTGPALAQTATDPSTSTPADSTPAPNPDDRIVCRQMPAPSGSRVGSQKVCATQAQWNAAYFNQQGGHGNIPTNAPVSGMAAPTATPHGASHGL